LIAKYQRRFPDFDDRIISMYACGMSVREIRGHLEELYGIDVSAGLISAVIGGGRGMAEPTAGCPSTRYGSKTATKALSVTRPSTLRGT
jgi:hypothetical protein